MTLIEELSTLAIESHEEYEKRLSLVLASGEATSELLDGLDDFLLDASTSAPESVERACQINLRLFGDTQIVERGWTFNTLLVSLAVQGKGAEFFESLRTALTLAAAKNLGSIGKSICKNAENAFSMEGIGFDNCIEVFTLRYRFYVACEEWTDAITELIHAAFHFSSFGAYQSAYRALHDAQSIAKGHSLFFDHARVLESYAIVAREEGDIPYAQDHFAKAVALLNLVGEPVPPRLRINLATTKMNLGAFNEALDEFKDVLADTNSGSALSDSIRNSILINISACQRELGDIASARTTIRSALSELPDHETELRVEANLVAARTLIRCDSSLAQTHLVEAIKLLEQTYENSVGRLHYRSGKRGQYLSRVKELLFSLPDSGNASALIDVLAFMRQSVLVEWASLLDWQESVSHDTTIDEELRRQLRTSFGRIVQLGAPILYSYREKYDDPFEDHPDFSFISQAKIWNDFHICLKNIERQCGVSPYSGSTIIEIANRLNKTLTSEVLLFVAFTGTDWRFITLCGDRYWYSRIPAELVFAFKNALLKDQSDSTAHAAILSAVSALQSAVEFALKDVFENIVNSSKNGIVILPDHLSVDIPVVGAIVANTTLRSRLSNGTLTLRCSPIAYERKGGEAISSYFGIWDSHSGLLSPREELAVSSQLLGAHKITILDLATERLNSNRSDLAQADVIQISSHGHPLSNFTESHFADLSGNEKSLYFEEIQRDFWRYDYQVALINTCYASDPTVRRMFQAMTTDDIIAYPSMLLLNRRSRVIAPLWGTFDIVGFILSRFFYERLSQGWSSIIAYSMAIARMFDITREELLSILTHIESPKLREQKMQQFGRSKEPYPLRHPYCYGVYALHTMLEDKQPII